jgi:hypothetical protein
MALVVMARKAYGKAHETDYPILAAKTKSSVRLHLPFRTIRVPAALS